MSCFGLSRYSEQGVDIDLLRTFLQSQIEESEAILDVESRILSPDFKVDQRLLLANAKLFLLVLRDEPSTTFG